MILRDYTLPEGAPQWRPSSPTNEIDSCPVGTIRKPPPTIEPRLQLAAKALMEQQISHAADDSASEDNRQLRRRRLHPLGHRSLRVEEARSYDLIKDLTSDLAKGRAMREFKYRYERRFSPLKWKWMADLWEIVSKNECLKFCPSLDRCFKRVLFRSSRYSCRTRGHPIQRVSLHELLHVVARNFRGSKKDTENTKGSNNQIGRSDLAASGKHRGMAEREILVQDIVGLVERLFDLFDVYKIGEQDYKIEEGNEEFEASNKTDSDDIAIRHTTKGSASDISTSYIDPREFLCTLRAISHPGIDAAEPFLRYSFDLYAHSWSVLRGTSESMLHEKNNGSVWGATSTASGLASGVEPSFPLQIGSTAPMSNDDLCRNSAMPSAAASLLLSGFARVTSEDEYVPWREWQMACVVTATNDWELELLSGLATRAFLGPPEVDVPQAAALEALLREDENAAPKSDGEDDEYIPDRSEFDVFDGGIGREEREELERQRSLSKARRRNRKKKHIPKNTHNTFLVFLSEVQTHAMRDFLMWQHNLLLSLLPCWQSVRGLVPQ